MFVARKIIDTCMGVRPGESVLVVTDTVRKDLGMPIYQAALDHGNDAVYMEMSPRDVHGDEPPKAISDAMLDTDVIIVMTKTSMSHTQAKIHAVENGARIATMPFGGGSTEFVTRVFTEGGINTDYPRMDSNIRRMADRLEGTKQAHVVTEMGTDVVIDYGGRKFYIDNGIVHRPGEFTNLPAGELFIAPVDANGTIVVDTTVGRVGKIASPLEIKVRDGMAYSFKGEHAEDTERLLLRHGPKALNVAEFAIGMNPNARICGLMVEDEKVGNTVHFALGNNMAFGGDVDVGIHVDYVVDAPRVYIDGERLDIAEYL